MIVGGGLVVGTLIVVGAILPAEYNVDPLGLGKLSGMSRLWAPEEKAWTSDSGAPVMFEADGPPAHYAFEIPLGASDWPEAALEYKFAMKPGQAFLYHWAAFNADGSPASVPVEFDFHGHTVEDGKTMTVAEYRKDRALSDQGSLTAPFEGIHGWYFKNHAPDPVIIRLEVNGYISLVAPGQPGNEFRIAPVQPAAQEAAPR